jgi:peptidyl-tRNA hydrolase
MRLEYGDLANKRVKVIAIRNLKMSGLKTAAQSVHASLILAGRLNCTPGMCIAMGNLTCVVLEVSKQKFVQEVKAQRDAGNTVVIFEDAGYTEVAPKTITCAAWLEEDPKADSRAS